MTTGALQGLLYCANILIPSLFPFMVLSSFIVTSGMAESLGKFLSPITKRLFHTDGATGSVILLGLCGGFPVGAKGIATLYSEDKINHKTATALSMFLVGGGPAFVVSAVGSTMYNSTTTGLILWGIQILTQIALGTFACRKLEYTPPKATVVDKTPISNAIVLSTESGIHSIFSMCGMVIVFSSVFGLCEDLHIIEQLTNLLGYLGINNDIALGLLSSLWEVTKGCNTCCDSSAPLWLTAFALGFGGVCVHFQIYSLTSTINIPKIKFTLYRLAQGVISAVITAVVFTFYTPAKETYNTQTETPIVCNSYLGSVALVIMCIIFTLSVTQKSNPRFSRK